MSSKSKYKIGIFGSPIGPDNGLINKLQQLGRELAKHKVILITGACTGAPYIVIYEAVKKTEVEVWGFSSEVNLQQQKIATPDDDLSVYSKLIYIPKNFRFIKEPAVCKKYRNVMSTAICDAGVIIAGRWGTLNEFTNLVDMGKIIAVLTKTGGIADELSVLTRKIKKGTEKKIIYNNSAKELVKELIHELSTKARKNN